jgi:site-specific recombinase XerC
MMLITEQRWLDLSERWLTWISTNCTPLTLRNRAHYIGVVAARYRHRPPESLDTEDLAAVLACDRWSPEARKSCRSTMRGFYGWMTLTGRIPRDPAAALPAIRIPRAVPRPVPVSVFVDAVTRADVRTRLILQLGRFGGLRRAEVAQVWPARDVAGRWLTVHGKGGHERRVPLHPVAAGQLDAAPGGWLFPSPVGGHLTPDHVGVLASRALPPGWTLHTCRHRAGTDWYSVSRDIRAVQELLGHATVSTTQRYVQVEDDALWAAVMAVPA